MISEYIVKGSGHKSCILTALEVISNFRNIYKCKYFICLGSSNNNQLNLLFFQNSLLAKRPLLIQSFLYQSTKLYS